VGDAAVFRRLRTGSAQAVEAVAVALGTPVADAVAMFVRVVQALVVVGIFELTVAVYEAPGASVPGVQVSVPLKIEQLVPD
jgi:hypothetical protein